MDQIKNKINSQGEKMKTLIIILSSVLLTVVTSAHPNGPGVTNAKAIELSAHRIDRLVALGKIDASFLKNLENFG